MNIAAAEMDFFRDGELSTHMLAVSGRPGDETPIVSSAIDSIVLNPPWYVPSDIARREIVPKGAAYMRARRFVWRDGRLIQQPGPKAALGLVKFDFPNPYAVYLHDTPTKSTFSQPQRAASHGCVRLEHAVELARTLVAEEPGASAGRIDRILTSGKTAPEADPSGPGAPDLPHRRAARAERSTTCRTSTAGTQSFSPCSIATRRLARLAETRGHARKRPPCGGLRSQSS